MQNTQLQSYVLKPYILDLLNEISRDTIKRRVKRELILLSEDNDIEIITISFYNKGLPIITVADMKPTSNNNNNNDSASIYMSKNKNKWSRLSGVFKNKNPKIFAYIKKYNWSQLFML